MDLFYKYLPWWCQLTVENVCLLTGVFGEWIEDYSG